jgi:predicted acylesterase/phospholipase RssA
MLLSDPVAQRNVTDFRPVSRDAGFNARAVLNRGPRPEYRLGRTPVATAIVDYAKENPIGVAGRFMERAVDTMITAALGADATRSWSLDDSRLAFAIAFGLDRHTRDMRNQLLGLPIEWPGIADELPAELRNAVLTPIDFGPDPADPFGNSPFGSLDDLFQRTCVLGVFDALHDFGRAVADAPREYTSPRITKLEPDHGCTGDRIIVCGTGFGPTQAPGLDLVFPSENGGWLSIDVPPPDWSDTQITVTLPAGVGVGPVGFVQVNPNATPVTEAASRFAGEMGACFGAATQLRAQTVIGKLGGLGKVTITETPFNRFRGGKPKIDYFLANGALKTVIRPGGSLLLQWSVINADEITIRKVPGAPAELPEIPAGTSNESGEINFPAVPADNSWTGSYEVVAVNGCGEVRQTVEIQMGFRKALALAGGGAKGAFEVGAVRCLYDVFNYAPDLLTGASVGALNAAKLAEGPMSLPELEKLWLDMEGPTDLFYIRGQLNTILTQLDPAIRQELQLRPLEDLLGWTAAPTPTAILNLNIAGRTLSFLNSRVASAVGAGTLFTVFDLLMTGLDYGLKVGKIVQAVQQLLLLPSLLLFDPVRDKIQANVTPSKITASGLALRIVVSGFRTGRVRYVDETGGFVDGGPAPGIISALNASASIPIAYPPVRLPDGEDYVDGGVLENTPIEAAVRAGADSIIAVLPSPAELDVPLAAPTELLPVAGRAVEMLLDGSSRRQLAPFRGWGVPVQIIAPRFELYNLLVVDPGLIRINMDYGYMRAYDEMQTDESLRPAYRASSEAITKSRLTVWYQEHWALGEYPKGFPRTGQIQPTGSADQVEWVRERKKEIRDLVVARVGLTGASVKASVPTTIANAWREWEGHFFAPFSNFLTPWDAYADFPGPILQAEAAPPPLP